MTPSEESKEWESRVPAQKFLAVARFRRLRKGLIEGVIRAAEDYLNTFLLVE